MKFEEIEPHLNKISTLYLKNNKRKVGWLFVDVEISSSEPLEEVYFVCMQKGRKITEALENNDLKRITEVQRHEKILLREIVRVRSSK
jgi:hypothetical protein